MPYEPRQRLKSKLRKRETVIGVIADYPAPGLVERLGLLGFDFVLFDCEHAGPDFERIVEMARAAHAAECPVLLRPWCNEPGLIRRFIDCGIDGLIVSQVESAAQAQDIADVIVAAEPKNLDSFILAPLVETREGVGQAESICTVPAVDMVAVGASDLAISFGHSRGSNLPEIREIVLGVVGTVQAKGRSACLSAGRYGAKAALDGGANVLLFSTRELLEVGFKQCLQGIDVRIKADD